MTCATSKASSPRWNPATRWRTREDRAGDGQGQGAAGQPVRARRQGHQYRGARCQEITTMSRIQTTFDKLKQHKRKALIPFFTAGDPDPKLTVPLLHALVEAGADVIELGVPFSDPMADGPTIQRASERALKHHVRPAPCAGHGGRIPPQQCRARPSC